MGPVGGTGGLGGASFKLFVDDAPLIVGLKRAEGQARKSAKAIGDEIHAGSSRGAMGLLALSQAVDDAQYGFRAIVNNIPQVANMFGAAGLAGGIGIAAVAINQLVNHWDDLKNLFQTDFIIRQAEATKELADQTEKAAKEAEKLLAAQLPSHEAGKEMIAKGAIGANAKIVADAIEEALIKELGHKKSKPITGTEFVVGMITGGMVDLAAQRRKKERADIRTRAEFLMGAAGTDESSRKKIEELMKAHPEAFAGVPGFAGAIKGAAPENMATINMLEKQGKEGEAIDKVIEASRKLAEAKFNEAMKIEEETILHDIDIENRKKRQQLNQQIEMLEGHRQHILKEAHNIRPSQVFQGGRAFATHMLTGGLDVIAKQQLKEAEKLNGKIDALRKDLAKVGQMQFVN